VTVTVTATAASGRGGGGWAQCPAPSITVVGVPFASEARRRILAARVRGSTRDSDTGRGAGGPVTVH
jgi:hypothetical protein